MLLCLWHWLAAAAPIQPLAWEPPYATGAAVGKKKEPVGYHNIESLPSRSWPDAQAISLAYRSGNSLFWTVLDTYIDQPDPLL